MRNGSRRPPLLGWLVFGVLAVGLAAFVALAVLAWQESRHIQTLQAEVNALQGELSVSHLRLEALQSTATTMEDRVASLEASDPAQQIEALQAAVETAGDAEQYADLREALEQVQSKVDSFQINLDELGTRIETLRPGASDGSALPDEARITVARQKQSRNLSCESSAASMVARYHSLDLDEAEVLAALPLSDNPYLGFRGNVDGPTGGIQDYGVYSGPILDILNNRGLVAWSLDGGLAAIKTAIARGNPVIAWVTYDCLPSTPATITVDGATVTLVPNQHVVVVTGYNKEGVWANDPWDGAEDYYSTADFERALSYFDFMAIEVATP